MKEIKLLRDINKLFENKLLGNEEPLILKTILETVLKEKKKIENSLKEIDEIVDCLEKKVKIHDFKNKSSEDLSIKQIKRIRRPSHDRVKVNLYLAEPLRSKLDNLNTTQKPLSQWIRGSLDNYSSNPEYKKSIDQYLSNYEDYEKTLFKNKEPRKTFVVAIEKENFDILQNLSESNNKDVRFIIESILFNLPQQNL
jgi:hypothetical protein